MAFPKFHGIQLANGSWIENAHFERLTSDPVPVNPGRVWYNLTEKSFKYSTLDAQGAVVVRSFGAFEDLTASISAETAAREAAVSALDVRLDTIEGSYATQSYVTSAIAALGNAFEYVGTLEGGLDAASAVDLSALAKKEAGDYYKVSVGGYFKIGAEGSAFFANVKDGLLWNAQGAVDIIDNTDSGVVGTADFITVTGSTDIGFTVDLASSVKTRISTLESGLVAEKARAEGAEAALSSRVADLEAAVDGATGDLAQLTTDAKTDLVSAINEVDSHADSAAAAAASVQAELDATQAGAGLNANGAYSAPAAANYISEATSLKDADEKLDAALKAERDRAVAAETQLGSDIAAAGTAAAEAVATEKTRAETAEAGLQSAIDAEAARAAGVEGSLADLTTTAKGNLVSAINEVKTLAGQGTDALRQKINAGKKTFLSPVAALTHTFSHGLNTQFLDFTVWTEGTDGKFRNDVVAVEEVDSNTLRVDLAEARRVKIVAEAGDEIV